MIRSTDAAVETVSEPTHDDMRPSRSDGTALPSYVWQLLGASGYVGKRGDKGAYYEHARKDLIDLFSRPPRTLLDVGCASGAAAAEVKRRFPAARVLGIEINERAAALARTRIDAVACGDCMTMDLDTELGIARGTLDAVLIADVLEHMYDPWSFLSRLHQWLSVDAVVVSSIPNARNLWLLNELAAGHFRYEVEGLLDITHIRFFTLREMHRMFAETGYRVTRVEHYNDARLAQVPRDSKEAIDLELSHVSIKNVPPQDIREFKALQFYLVAMPLSTNGR